MSLEKNINIVYTFLRSHTAKVLFLALMYMVTGKLGLLLALPPGYATVIWPPSGIALGALIIYGWRLWPGILLGSFILNCYISSAYSPETGLILAKTLPAFGIAIGSTLQALTGYVLICRFIGLPLKLNNLKEIAKLFICAAPAACLIAATVGVSTLHYSGVIPSDAISGNWMTWWMGDMFGILVFLPLMLFMPYSPNRIIWRGNHIDSLPATVMLMLLVPLGLTFYAWKITSENIYKTNLTEFETLALESEKALTHRLQSYENALLGGVGFFHGLDHVSRQQWYDYVEALNLEKNFPGINGIGYIKQVSKENIPSFLKETRQDGAPDFIIHPETVERPYYIITYIEPETSNLQALGLNIGFEDHRLQAAELSGRTGKSAITKRIVLVQDEQRTPGFLLLHPLHKENVSSNQSTQQPLEDQEWIYAPFIAKEFMKDLTKSQDYMLNLRIYDGDKATPETLIYNNNDNKKINTPTFSVQKSLEVMQQKWLIIWESTPIYEQKKESLNPLLILVGGLLFTGLFGLSLIVMIVRNRETMEWMSGEQSFVFPALIFFIIATGSLSLRNNLEKKELQYIKNLIEKEADTIESLLISQTESKLSALKRMGMRWEISERTPFKIWQADAINYLHQLAGLKTVDWIDNTYHIRWVEPVKGNENVIGLDILLNEQRQELLKEASSKPNSVILTPPLDLVQGYQGIIAYYPIFVKGKFDGLIAGIFSVDEFFQNAFSQEIRNNYAFRVQYDGKDFFYNDENPLLKNTEWNTNRTLLINDKKWQFNLTPTPQFITEQQTLLPEIVMVAGLIIAALSSLTIRYVLISRLKNYHLIQSKQKIQEEAERFSTVVNTVLDGLITIDQYGIIKSFNPAAVRIFGYQPEEVIGQNMNILMPESYHTEYDRYLRHYQIIEEKNVIGTGKEVTGKRKDGSIFPLELSVNQTHLDGKKMSVGTIRDITERKQIERMKSEFVSVVSHELRTPLTAIRGSLGLMVGTMAKDIPEKANHLIRIAHQNSERLILLINDILDIDKIAAGQMRFNLKEESLAPLIQQAAENNLPYAQNLGVSIITHPIDPALHIILDDARFLQIMANLLSNAAKFSPKGSIIEIFTTQLNEQIRIVVKDHGSGIPQEFRPYIFEKFSQANASSANHKGGTGLGLHISREMVTRMGGTIGFETELGKGTSFWIDFPLVIKRVDTKINQNASVLICEDNQTNAMIIQMMLENAGIIADVAYSIAEAKQKIGKHPYTAVTMDSHFPDGEGIDLIRELQSTPVTSALPIIMISGDNQPIDNAGDVNIEAWLVKPIKEELLIKELRRFIS